MLLHMDRIQRAIIVSLIATSALAWGASINQPDMMVAMTTYDPLAISVFTASWTSGMAAMMFPAITPMVLMYNRLVTNQQNNRGRQSSVTVKREQQQKSKARALIPSIRNILFVGSYLLVWAFTGIGLLLGWSLVMNNTIMTDGDDHIVQYLYGIILIIAGAYQFTPLKRICIGYCESPLSFFMRRWRDGTFGALKMGLYHGIYCLGCCWAYFLLMVALGWMNLLWMGLFAAIIFGEKIWSKGIWVARGAGIVLIIVGVFVAAGMLPSLVPPVTSPMANQGNQGGNMMSMTQGNDAMGNKSDNPMVAMDNLNSGDFKQTPVNGASSTTLADRNGESSSRALDYGGGGSANLMETDRGDKDTSMKDME
jgi:predicted metal-binding membrane protein